MVDLHVHTTASLFDGFTPPEEVVAIAYSNSVKAIAITDHNSVKGIDPAIKAGKKLGIEVVPGVEMTANYNETPIHIVGLFINPSEPSLLQLFSELAVQHTINNQLMVGVLVGMGLSLTIEQIAYLVEINSGAQSFMIPYLERQEIINKNDKETKQKIKEKLMIPNYCKYKRPKHNEIITHIHKAGGLAILAHPLRQQMDWDGLDTMLMDLKSCGLEGIEVYYSHHNEMQKLKLLKLSQKYDLLCSGGSDFHGYEKNDGLDIGKGLYGSLVPFEAFQKMKGIIAMKKDMEFNK